MEQITRIKEAARRSGILQTGLIPAADLQFDPEIRKICAGNVCRSYGASWACPPAVGTLEECQKRVEKYRYMLLFAIKYELEGSFDLDGMKDALMSFKKNVSLFDQQLRDFLPDYLLLSNEGCFRCKTCTYPDSPCRFPDTLHHAIEGYGFSIADLATSAGIPYNQGKNTLTFFGGLLFSETDIF